MKKSPKFRFFDTPCTSFIKNPLLAHLTNYSNNRFYLFKLRVSILRQKLLFLINFQKISIILSIFCKRIFIWNFFLVHINANEVGNFWMCIETKTLDFRFNTQTFDGKFCFCIDFLNFHKTNIVAIFYNSSRGIEWHQNYPIWTFFWVNEAKTSIRFSFQ
jgi:hypothetical protein